METNVQPVKVVESNNFLMYTLHDVVIKSGPCKGLRSSHTVYVFSYLFYMYTFLCKSTFGCLRKSCSLTPSCAFMLLLKKYTRVAGDELCILFERFAMDVCHTLL